MAVRLFISAPDALAFTKGELTALEQVYSTAFPHIHTVADLILVTKPEIQELNLAKRSINEATDVLSFPTMPGIHAIEIQSQDKEVLIGSIVICPEKAKEYEETLITLAHHGLLHLLGFDHEVDRVQWNQEENRILDLAKKEKLPITGIPDDAV